MIVAVIGKNFGDEGKGLAVDYFSGRVPHCIVVKHNGGAQAGHTVRNEGRRFVFHQLSSGSFRGADTFFASTYYPDFFKLREEAENFRRVNRGAIPKIYCSTETPLIYVDDIILNMALENSRGEGRHGSCGMGINEGDLRTKAGYALRAGEVIGMSAEHLAGRLRDIREAYTEQRRREAGLDHLPEDLEEILSSGEILRNAAEEMARGAEYVQPVPEEEFLSSEEEIIFESGQGLLLDCKNRRFAPHVTASRTGLTNIRFLLEKANRSLSEVCYVTRTYVTRHGAGLLPCETAKEAIGRIADDRTNVENPWQGSIRYGKHESVEEFLAPVLQDLKNTGDVSDLRKPEKPENPGVSVSLQSNNSAAPEIVSLFITHLNETGSQLVFRERNLDVKEFLALPEVKRVFGGWYLSDHE